MTRTWNRIKDGIYLKTFSFELTGDKATLLDSKFKKYMSDPMCTTKDIKELFKLVKFDQQPEEISVNGTTVHINDIFPPDFVPKFSKDELNKDDTEFQNSTFKQHIREFYAYNKLKDEWDDILLRLFRIKNYLLTYAGRKSLTNVKIYDNDHVTLYLKRKSRGNTQTFSYNVITRNEKREVSKIDKESEHFTMQEISARLRIYFNFKMNDDKIHRVCTLTAILTGIGDNIDDFFYHTNDLFINPTLVIETDPEESLFYKRYLMCDDNSNQYLGFYDFLVAFSWSRIVRPLRKIIDKKSKLRRLKSKFQKSKPKDWRNKYFSGTRYQRIFHEYERYLSFETCAIV
ncbi:MAG: hypothetical protein ACRDFB_02855, partial [Rhabdochlamydiaceae bacterium]